MSDSKLAALIRSPNRLERTLSLVEIRVNERRGRQVPTTGLSSINDLINRGFLSDECVSDALKAGGEAEKVYGELRSRFDSQCPADPPFPPEYNADPSFGQLCYAIARCRAPLSVVETGVGYGLTSALILEALERNGDGALWSIDLPPLGNSDARYTGLAIPSNRRHRWNLRLGSSRRVLPQLLRHLGGFDLFISDSANVYTLQRREMTSAWPRGRQGAVFIFNNVDERFRRWVQNTLETPFFLVEQAEKECVTGLAIKR